MIRMFYRQSPGLLALALCLVVGAGCTKAAKARRLLSVADKDFQAQRYDAAEVEYQSVLRLSRLDPAAIRQLGLLYFEEGRPEASVYLRKSLEQDSNNPVVQLKMADVFASSGKAKDALQLLDTIRRNDPANERALLLLVEITRTNNLPDLRRQVEAQLDIGGNGVTACLSTLGLIDIRLNNISQAEAELQKARDMDPKTPTPYLGFAALCAVRKDTNGVENALKSAAELSPVRSPTRIRYVEFKVQSGAAEQAKEMLREMTRQAPDYIPAWLCMMRLAFAEHKADECKAAIDSILARDNANFEALMELGNLAVAQRDPQKALATFQRLDALYNNQPAVKYHLARSYLLNNERAKAVASLNEALSVNRNYAQAALLLAELDLRMGNSSEAVTLLSQLVKGHPENVQTQLALARAYLIAQQPTHAIETYRQMAQRFPRSSDIPRLIGMVFEQERDFAQAHAAYEQSLELAPDNLPALERITDLDISQRRFDDAHRRVAAAIEKNPNAAEPWMLQGGIFWAEGLTNKAESALTNAIRINDQLPGPYLLLARLYVASHQEQQALDRLNALVAKTNDITAMLEIGEIHQADSKYDAARAAYEKLLAVNPKFVPALNNLAYVYSEYLGNIDKAAELAQTARDLRPYDEHTTDTLGWILYRQHQYARALSLIEESAEKQPNDPEVQWHLGMAHYMMDEEKPARLCLREAISSHYDFPGKEQARRCLAILDIDPATATPEVIRQLESRVSEDPQDPIPLSRLAAIHERQGEPGKAADAFRTLIARNPKDEQAMIKLARLYAGPLNDPRQALELAQSSHTLAPDDPVASALLGELVFRTGDYSWALNLLEQADHQSPDQPSVLYHLALARYSAGQAARADNAMQQAVAMGGSLPELDQAKQFLALRAAAESPAKAQAAAALARAVLDKEPNNLPALMVSALAQENQGAYTEAENICEKALAADPLFTPAMRELAILYARHGGDQTKAYALAEKASASFPKDLELGKVLGVLAYRQGNYDRSLRLLGQITPQLGNDGETLCYLGMDYYHLKRRPESKEALLRALAFTNVPPSLATEARRVLAELK